MSGVANIAGRGGGSAGRLPPGGREVGRLLEKADAPGMNATLAWSRDHLAAEAARMDRAVAGLRQSPAAELPLAGVPVALKDNIVTTDLPTTCGSRILEGYVSPFSATVVDRSRARQAP